MEYKLSPSILSADFCNLEEGIRQTEKMERYIYILM